MKYICHNKCCEIITQPFKWLNEEDWNEATKNSPPSTNQKAGICLIDKTSKNKKNHKILLIQSAGNLWGPPKGSSYFGESFEKTAKRELKEETGIDITKLNLSLDNSKSRRIDSTIYYFIEINMTTCGDINQNLYEDINDASGYTWINPYCINSLRNNNNKYGIRALTYHTILLFETIFNIRFDIKNQKFIYN